MPRFLVADELRMFGARETMLEFQLWIEQWRVMAFASSYVSMD
jgi:hypothetical protein